MSDKAIVTKLLRRLGFARVSSSVSCARMGDVYHLVGVSTDRRLGGLQIEVAVWHPQLNPNATRPTLLSPLIAMVAPDGAHDNWTWGDASLDIVQIERVITGFFSGFCSLEDAVACLEGRDASAYTNANATAQLEVAYPPSTYHTFGGTLGLPSVTRVMSQFLRELCTPLGFALIPTDDLVMTRSRGRVQDCVSIRLDKFGTLATVAVFQWLPEIWQANRVLRGTYHPFNGSLICGADGRISLVNPIRIADSHIDFIRGELTAVLSEWAFKVFDLDTYLPTIKPEYGLIADNIRRRGGVRTD